VGVQTMKLKRKAVMIGTRPGVVLKLAWVDFDPSYPVDVRYELYHTKAEQRDNRPDLKPIRVALVAIR
jgi:hypothetical protein